MAAVSSPSECSSACRTTTRAGVGASSPAGPPATISLTVCAIQTITIEASTKRKTSMSAWLSSASTMSVTAMMVP